MQECYFIVPDCDIYIYDHLVNNLNIGNLSIMGSIRQYMNKNMKALPVLFNENDAIIVAKKMIQKLRQTGSESNLGDEDTLKQYPIFGAIIMKFNIDANMNIMNHENKLFNISKGGIRDYTKLFSKKCDMNVYEVMSIQLENPIVRGVIHSSGLQKLKVNSFKYVFDNNMQMPENIGFALLNNNISLKTKYVKLLKKIYDCNEDYYVPE